MRVNLTKEIKQVKIDQAKDIFKVMQKILGDEKRYRKPKEYLWTVCMSEFRQIILIELVGFGAFNFRKIKPAHIFDFALQKQANSLAVIHKYPGGELTPYDTDKELVERLTKTGDMVNLPVFDYMLMTQKNFYSFANSGLLEELRLSHKYMAKKERELVFEEGLSEGLTKGFDAGTKTKAIECATVCLNSGLSATKTAKLTGLPLQEVREIKEKIEG